MGVLRQPCVEHEEEQPWRNAVPEPVLLMEDVAYMLRPAGKAFPCLQQAARSIGGGAFARQLLPMKLAVCIVRSRD